MNRIITTLFAILLCGAMYAQAPEISLEYEEFEIDPAALSTIEAQTGEGVRVVRVYLRIPEFWELQTLYSDFFNALDISTSTSFYQNSLGSATSNGTSNLGLALDSDLAYDSWLTIGAEQAEGSLLVVAPNEDSFASFEAGGNILINDPIGTALLVPTEMQMAQNSPDENGRILISQFTTDGEIDACYNFQIRRFNPDGTPFDPPGPGAGEFYSYTNQCINIPAPSLSLSCFFDLDDNGQVSIADLLILLSEYGCQSNCDIDLNGDGDTGFEEVVAFLAVFNSTCE